MPAFLIPILQFLGLGSVEGAAQALAATGVGAFLMKFFGVGAPATILGVPVDIVELAAAAFVGASIPTIFIMRKLKKMQSK